MGCFEWANSIIKKMTWLDIGSIKLAVAGFVLMIAKLWPCLLGIEWYWFALIGVLACIRPLITIFSKG